MDRSSSRVHDEPEWIEICKQQLGANILVTDEGAVKLLDFGVAKLLDPKSDSGLTIAAQWA